MRAASIGRWVALLTLAGGCDRVQHLTLPDPAPEAELAFGVLYDGATAAVIGPVVRRQAVYAGRYSLNGAGGLTPRLHFVRLADLTAAAQLACDRGAAARDRVLCRERIEACAEAPEACWSAARADEGCGPRLSVGAEVPVETFRLEDGRLTREAGEQALGVTLCGPPVVTGCPNRRAGYAVFEGGKLACIPEVRQLDCTITMDLSACGLPRLAATLDDAGRPTLGDGDRGCVVGAPSSSSAGPFGGPADFTLTCGGLTFDLFAQDTLLSEAGCERRGPGTYETEGSSTGRISGALAVEQAGAARLLMTGGGRDDCATFGCGARGSSCSEACFDNCLTQVLAGPCARDSWASCAPLDESDTCQLRCQTFCARPRDDNCYDETSGAVLTTSALDLPELDRFRADLDGDGTTFARGHPTLAPLVGGWVAVATERRLYAYAAAGADAWTRQATLDMDLELFGVVAPAPDALAYFGVRGVVPEVRRVEVTRGANPSLTAVGVPVALTGLSGADVAALGGPRGDWVFVAATQPRLTGPAPRHVQAAALEGDVALAPVELAGDVTALLGLPGGHALVAYARDGDLAEVAVLQAGSAGVDAVHPLTLFAGVRVSALALDPVSCAGAAPSACRIFVALERSMAAQPAQLGALVYDAADPAGLEVQAGLRPIGPQSVSLLVPSLDGRELWAISGGRNVLTPLRLLD